MPVWWILTIVEVALGRVCYKLKAFYYKALILLCWINTQVQDKTFQAHSLSGIFGNIVDQEEIAKAICKIIRRRATLLDQLEDMEKENQSTGA